MGDSNRHSWNAGPGFAPSAPPLVGDPWHDIEAPKDLLYGLGNGTGQFHKPRPLCDSKAAAASLTPPPDAVDGEPDPSAPPLELMDKVPGYETASFEAVDVPPPLVPVLPKEEDLSQRAPLPSIPHLTEKEVRQALFEEVSSHCCFGTRAVQDMAITDIKHSIAFHYTLETFTEKRTTCWAYEPYISEPIDEKNVQQAPFPWDIPVSPPALFRNSIVQMEVPSTSSVKTCHVCGGVGRKKCCTCSGNGWEYCYSCHGDGHKASALESENGRCLQCHGTGRRKCWKCNGEGKSVCKGCTGSGQIKCFIRLTITWTNHVDDHVVEKVAALAGDRIRNATGEIVCQEEATVLQPLTHFPDTTVSMASAQLIQQHANSFTSEKVLKQRHRVSIVPVAAVSYRWKNKEGLFHVYGYEQKVYAPDYPQTCCCTIL